MFVPKKLIWWPTGLRCDNKIGLVQGTTIPVDEKGSLSNAANIILMQYTGLNDKNGKEIYEGDIVEHRNFLNEFIGRYEVRWGQFGFTLADPSKPLENYYVTPTLLEVIGNIHSNPELCKL